MSELLAYLQSLSSNNVTVSLEHIEHMQELLKQMPEEMSLQELHEFLNYISDQVGLFEAEWEFSPAVSPNTSAKQKADSWDALWNKFSSMLLGHVPDLKNQLQEKHRLIIARHSMAKSLDFNKEKPVRKSISAGLSRIAISLHTLGLSSIANRLYQIALYPSGTIGRLRN